MWYFLLDHMSSHQKSSYLTETIYEHIRGRQQSLDHNLNVAYTERYKNVETLLKALDDSKSIILSLHHLLGQNLTERERSATQNLINVLTEQHQLIEFKHELAKLGATKGGIA